MNTYSDENFLFLIVRIFISICIAFNMYSFECIKRLSNFYWHMCDKDLRYKLSFEK